MLFTFHSRYFYAIGREVVLSLGGWAPQIHAGFHVSGATREHLEGLSKWSEPHPASVVYPQMNHLPDLSSTGLSPSVAGLSRPVRLGRRFVTFCSPVHELRRPTTPCAHRSYRPFGTHGLGWFPFARRYSGSRGFSLFLQVLRCFSSLGLPP